MLWKYASRLLIVTTGVCAVHCRFCFRRHFPYQEGGRKGGLWTKVLEKVAAEPSIREVILSGGDPLSLDDEVLRGFVRQLAEVGHVRRIRVHTRLPVLVPQRVTGEMLDWLRGTRLAPLVAIHVNHAAEIDEEVGAALGRIVDAGVPVLSQTVLLRGVNDRVEALAELFERLVDLRVMPYYLHQLDRVEGAAHFEVPIARGMELVQQLRAILPGYAIPRYVREDPEAPSKTLLA
jgi:EF-P beta-lysylation protein EpmB